MLKDRFRLSAIACNIPYRNTNCMLDSVCWIHLWNTTQSESRL